MFGRTGQAETFFVFTTLEIEIGNAGTGVGVCRIQSDTFHRGCDETEIALPYGLDTEKIGIATVFRLCELSPYSALIFFVVCHFIHDKALYSFIENSCGYQSD